ncbi:MAG TPA: M50 family metallopeptidase [Bacteroidales bacterium]|mgnify:CR=1 FL=1|nr:M50 family metallopeptidase [Bacteroidales bacterium]
MEELTPTYQFLFSITAAILLTQVPYIGKYFKVIYTLIHESMHATTALIINAEVIQIELFSNTSGTTLTKYSSNWKKFIISFVAYPFSIIISWGLYYTALKGFYWYGLLSFLIIIILNLTFFVRNIYGIFWLISFGIIIGIILYFKNILAISIVLYIIAGIILIESIISVFQLLILSLKNLKQTTGDVKNIQEITKIPAIFWIIIFLLILSFVTYKIVISFLT